jgi:hypothetical protein
LGGTDAGEVDLAASRIRKHLGDARHDNVVVGKPGDVDWLNEIIMRLITANPADRLEAGSMPLMSTGASTRVAEVFKGPDVPW